jgi:type IV pilus assembly protein PilN
MGRSDLRKIENKTGTKDADKKAPYVFSLDVKLRKPEDAQNEKAVAGGNAAGAEGEDATEPAADKNAPPAAPESAAPAPAPAPAANSAEKGEKK